MAVTTTVRRIGAAVVAVAVLAAAVILTLSFRHHAVPAPSCRVATGSETYTLEASAHQL